MIKYFFPFLFVLLLFNQRVEAQDTLRFAALADNPPFSWIDGNIHRGIDIDIVREAGKRAGYIVEFTQTPWKRMIGRIKSSVDDGGFPLFYRPEREKFAVFSTVPIRMARFSMFIASDRTEATDFEGMKAYEGKTVGQIRGLGVSAAFAHELKEYRIRHVEVDSTDQGLQMLIRGRLDGFVNDTLTTQYMISKVNLSSQVTMLSPEVNEGEGVFLVFAKEKYKDTGEAMAAKFDAALKKMYEDGTIISIVKYYLQ